MADTGIKISALTAATSADDADVLAGVQSSTTKKFSFSVLLNYIKSKLTPSDIGAAAAADIPAASTATPEMDGTASAGSSTAWARGDHVHPANTNKADVDGSYRALTAGQILSDGKVEDKVPYTFRKSGGEVSVGNRENDTIVGGTVAWNQIVPIPNNSISNTQNGVSFVDNRDGTYSVSTDENGATADTYLTTATINNAAKGNRRLLIGCPAGGSSSTFYLYDGWVSFKDVGAGTIYANESSTNIAIRIMVKSGTIIAQPITFTPQLFDLTRMFGAAIADYIYALESATPGAGVAWFRNLFPKPYCAYNAGALLSVKASAHKTVGFNAYDNTTGTAKLLGGHQYQITGAWTALAYEDLGGNAETITPDADGLFTPVSTGTLTVTGGDGTTTCVHLVKDGSRNGEFSPYVSDTYPLDSDQTLRGIPKVDADGKLYYDGDTYEADGTVTRKYGYIADLGTLNWAERTTSGQSYQRFYATIAGIKRATNSNAIAYSYILGARKYNYESATHLINNTDSYDKCSGISGAGDVLIISDHDYATLEAFVAGITGVPMVYELAEATTESADPFASPQTVDNWGTEEYVVTEQSGVAVPVGHDTFYSKDLRGKLEAMPDSVPSTASIAPTENGDTASQAYAAGRYFFRNGDFCKALTSISAGASFTLNTNYAVTTIADELYTALH